LLALAEGNLSEDEAIQLDEHLLSCRDCEATLNSLEDDSDTLIRTLATLPVTTDDELAFQRAHADLLANPECFLGSKGNEPNATLGQDLTVGLATPFRLGNYELLEQIGAGAHGAVFRARHLRLEKTVAVKLLVHTAVQAVDDFLHEMRVIGKLDHPHIIRATDAGEVDGIHFLVMDFVPGLDVSSLLRRVGPLSVGNACEVARQAALGLAFAHQHGLVHRDIKTSNLLFSASGQVKLLDLGLATFASPDVHHAEPGNPMPRGTADYMAPEQWLPSGAVDARADLYSLGCTLYKMLTGVPPYRVVPSGFSSKQAAHREAPIPSLKDKRPEVPSSLDRFAKQLLAKRADDRPHSAEFVAEQMAKFTSEADLTRLAARVFPESAEQPVQAAESHVPRQHFGWCSRRTAVIGALAAGAATLASFWFPRRGPHVTTNRWRDLTPASPPYLVLPQSPPPRVVEKPSGELDVESQDLALIHLGRPVRGAFRWQTSLKRTDWSQPAGLFFRFRLQQQLPVEAFEFHTIEMVQGKSNRSQLRWMTYRIPIEEDVDATCDALATVEWNKLSPGKSYALEVTLGRVGFPEVVVNGQFLPESMWELSKEARDLMWTDPDRIRSSYLGRIGQFQSGGQTTFGISRMMYLDP